MSKKKLTKAEAFLSKWLQGSTCAHPGRLFIQWVCDDERFIVLKHKGHSEWAGRASGRAWCETYYCLFDMDKGPPTSYLNRDGAEPCLRYEGRWSKRVESLFEKTVELGKQEGL